MMPGMDSKQSKVVSLKETQREARRILHGVMVKSICQRPLWA